MPSNWLYIDTNFPAFTGEESMNEKVTTIQNYLFLLVEQLRYTLNNLDTSNMNGTALEQYSTSLTDPIYARIEDDEGNLTLLQVTAAGLASRVSDAEGNISTLQQTASSLTSQISDAQGDISILYQTAASLGSQISDLNGNISTLQQTASSLTSRISNAEGDVSALQQTAASLTSMIGDVQGDISLLQQTASSLTTRVGNAEGNITTLVQTVNGFGLTASNGESSSTLCLTSGGVTVSSTVISFSGMVTFTDLSTAGSTVINGANIATGSIYASAIHLGGDLTVYSTEKGTTVGGYLGYTTSLIDGSSGIHMARGSSEVAVTSNGARMMYASTNDQIYVASANCGIVSGGTTYYFSSSAFSPDSAVTLGTADTPWGKIYTNTSVSTTSDRNLKHDIEDLPDKYIDLIMWLAPKRFKLNAEVAGPYHVGFIAQDVEEGMALFGIDPTEFGGLVKETGKNGEPIYMLGYEEFLGIFLLVLQRHDAEIKTLRGE